MAEVTSGVKYLKINRLDANGKNRSPEILNADSIRINYSDIGPVQYDILTTQQQSNYYLLGIIPQPTTSSTNQVFDYDFLATGSFNISAVGTTILKGNASWSVVTDDGGNFLANEGIYTSQPTPNRPLRVTVTGSITSIGSTDYFYLYYNNTQITESLLNSSQTATIPQFSFITTGSGLLTSSLPGNDYLSLLSVGGATIFQLKVTWSINNIDTPVSNPSSLLSFSPEDTNFYSSDGNAIINNAVTPQYSTIYQDIDYSTGLIPTNFTLLISGNADYAPVQDSNYTATGWVNSRYKGSRASSPDFNVTT